MLRRSTIKKLRLAVLALLVLGVGYALYTYFTHDDFGPTNLPTPEERAIMQSIDQTSREIAPDAKAGIGVRPPGSIPKAPIATTTPEATTTDPTVEGEGEVLDEQGGEEMETEETVEVEQGP